jgi:hypothetical protein
VHSLLHSFRSNDRGIQKKFRTMPIESSGFIVAAQRAVKLILLLQIAS